MQSGSWQNSSGSPDPDHISAGSPDPDRLDDVIRDRDLWFFYVLCFILRTVPSSRFMPNFQISRIFLVSGT